MHTTSAPVRVDAAAAHPPVERSRREVLTALSGLLLAMFVAILSSTIVANALPTIVTDLDGDQSGHCSDY